MENFDMCMTHGILFVGDACPMCKAASELLRYVEFLVPDDWRNGFYKGVCYMADTAIGVLNGNTLSANIPSAAIHVSADAVPGATCSLDGG